MTAVMQINAVTKNDLNEFEQRIDARFERIDKQFSDLKIWGQRALAASVIIGCGALFAALRLWPPHL